MQAAVDDMLKKEAIQVSSENVITSPIFTVPKKGDDSKRRPVHNLRWVNQHIQKQKFKMLTMKEVKRAIFKDAYMAKIDLKDIMIIEKLRKDNSPELRQIATQLENPFFLALVKLLRLYIKFN